MSEGLEALKLWNCGNCKYLNENCGIIEDKVCPIKIIEKELKALQLLEIKCNEQGITLEQFLKYFVEESIDNAKKLKALEIIKKYIQILDYGIGDYLYACYKFNRLPQEEQKLLKEELTHD